jgi:hypothetical protein
MIIVRPTLASDLPESFAKIRDARPALPDWLAGTLFNKSREALGLWFFCRGPRLFLVAWRASLNLGGLPAFSRNAVGSMAGAPDKKRAARDR